MPSVRGAGSVVPAGAIFLAMPVFLTLLFPLLAHLGTVLVHAQPARAR